MSGARERRSQGERGRIGKTAVVEEEEAGERYKTRWRCNMC
jgi:hypothetical protein